MKSPLEISRVFYDPVLPVPLLLLAALALGGLTLFTYARDRRSVGNRRCLGLIVLRLLGLAGLFFILLNPQREVSKRVELLEQRVILALDTSASMAHADGGNRPRLDEARLHLARAGLLHAGKSQLKGLDFHAFDDGARPVSAAEIADLQATGEDTRFHQSLDAMLQSARGGQALAGIILLTDGHDFELVNPARTALDARARQTPLYALPLGGDEAVRDASIHIASYKPYVFSGQHSRIDLALRLIGCEYEDFTLELHREGERIESRRVSVGDESQRIESFEVLEETPGQYAYEFRLSTVRDEVTDENNRATTYLNVSDKKINLLLIEGSPYWDTNFTQRSLWSNEKFMIDSLTAVAPGKHIAMRKDPALGRLEIPATPEGFDAYDCVLLGKEVHRLLDPQQQQALADYVRDFGGTLIFTRGEPSADSPALADLSPVRWGEPVPGFAELEVNREGRSLAPFELLDLHGGPGTLYPVFGFQSAEARPLTSVLVGARRAGSDEPAITMAHRRAGGGQVMALAGTGFWRSGFHHELPDGASLFDRFWDNLILWIISGRNPHTGGDYRVLLNTANLALDQTLHLRMTAAKPEQLPAGLPVDLFHEDAPEPVDRVVLAPSENATGLAATYTPKAPGLYRAELALPDGSRETLRFAVYRDNREPTEVSVDLPFLQRLTQQSGGRILDPDELEPLVRELLVREEPEPLKRREPAWDTALLAFLITVLLALDWWLRRRWGLC